MIILPTGKAQPRALAAVRDPAAWSWFMSLSLLVTVVAALGANPSLAAVAQRARIQTKASPPDSLQLRLARALAQTDSAPASPPPGADVDGDGRSDFINPTGGAERSHDAYGAGAFGVSRDGGNREHQGVDYVSRVGQEVVAPMSGYVARIGHAYGDDPTLRLVEIVNPALNYVARVLYVSPTVAVGQSVAMGEVIGHAQTLQDRYPQGMTNHVHLQIARKGGAWMNCERLIPAARG